VGRPRTHCRSVAGSGPSLTPTELDVVRLVAKGLTNPEIATRLQCSRNTVKAHLAHVFAKLSLSTRAELAAEATRRGL
jgi:DNA-binding CsgD family transcriptional regulator